MPEPDETDTIIAITSALRSAMGKDAESSIYFPSIEENWQLPAGSVAKHLEEAAEDAGLEVVKKGSTRASLRKKGGGIHIA